MPTEVGKRWCVVSLLNGLFFFCSSDLCYAVVWSFHLMRPSLAENDIVASLTAFGIGWLFFAALSFVYMNHYSHPKAFYVWNVLDATLTFSVLAVANGLLYRRVMGSYAVEAAAKS